VSDTTALARTQTALVLVVVGTDHHPFDRLMRWVDACAAEPIGAGVRWTVQRGTSRPPGRVDSREYLSHGELEIAMSDASAVVCHGGPGTITDARSAGHVPIVVPRTRALGEHVDDHQQRFARRLADAGQIVLATDEDSFRRRLAEALATRGIAHERRSADHSCERFIALADRLLERPASGLLEVIGNTWGGDRA
jgi:UDP-N-acetylglucosamine transferase subunit ALG13